MKEIKFRVWDKTLKKWIDNVWLDVVAGKLVCRPTGELIDIDNPLTNIDLVGYTGLKDKNGKEIYEGDIVQGIGNNRRMKMEVNMHSFCGWPNVPPDCWEVIGNIWEHPELIKEEIK